MMSAARPHILLEDAGEIAGVLDRGRGIDLAADPLDRLGDLAGGARRWCP